MDFSDTLLWIFTTLVAIYASIYMFHAIRAERLTISADGIKHQTMFFTVYSTWDNVERIEKSSLGHKRLRLENPVFQKNKSKWTRWDLSMLLIRSRDFIPIGEIYWERYTEIEKTLRKHLPGLFP